MKYCKKPVIVEAYQFYHVPVPGWVGNALLSGTIMVSNKGLHGGHNIKTLEGIMHASCDDYIIRGVNGELYPCKPDIFKKIYEAVK
ncbi:MAG: hypothetical protein PVG39_24070 [Desulfobacteraceae bacterium]